MLITAGAVTLLYGWARNRSVGTINAAITFQWLEQLTTTLALIKPLTSISGHRFGFLMAAIGAGYG